MAKKVLFAIATALMAVAVVLGVAACDVDVRDDDDIPATTIIPGEERDQVDVNITERRETTEQPMEDSGQDTSY